MTSPRDLLNARQIARKAIPLQKAEVHDTAYVADADMLAADITPTPVGPAGATATVPDVIFRITVCLDTAAIFKIVIDDGTTEVDVALNSGAPLRAQSGYTFDWPIDPGDSINFEADTSCQIEKLIVHEILLATQ